MNKKKLIFAAIFIFAAVSVWLVFNQKPIPTNINLSTETNVSSNAIAKDMIGATNIKTFADALNNKINAQNANANRTKSAYAGRTTYTPIPLPYPRISINYTVQRMRTIRGITTDKNNTFIVVSLDIRNYGYKHFDAMPSKFMLGSLNPITNVSTGNMIYAVLPNNSETQGDLVFYTSLRQGFVYKINYVPGGYTIIYKQGGYRR